MANANIKISQLPNIGSNLNSSTLLPVVSTNGTFLTDKVTVGNLANFILDEAGNTLANAFVASIAYSVANAAQPNITSVGNLTGLTVTNLANLHIPGGTNGYVLQTNGNGNLSWTAMAGGGNGNPGGTNTQVQFNDSGVFNGSSGLTYNKTTFTLGTGNLQANNATISGNISTANINATGNISSNLFVGNGISPTGANFFIGNLAFNDSTIQLKSGANNQSIRIAPDGNFNSHAFLQIPDNDNAGSLEARLLNQAGNVEIVAGDLSTLWAWYFRSDGFMTTPGPISASGDITTNGNVSAGNLLGDGGNISNISGANIEGTVANANYAAHVDITPTANNFSYHVVLVQNPGDNNLAVDGDDNLQYNPADGTLTTIRLDTEYLNVTYDVVSNLIPFSNVTYDLGNNTNRWKDIYLSNSSIYLGDATISANGNSIVVDSITVTNGNVGTIGNIASINLNGSNSNVLYGNGVFAPVTGGGGGSELVNGDNSFVLDSAGNVVFEGETPGDGVNRGLVWDYGSNVNGLNSEVRQDMFGVTVRAWTEQGGGANGFSAPVRIVTNQDTTEKVWLFEGQGNLILPGNIISINDGGHLGAQVLLQPDLGKARLAARTIEYTENFNSGGWTNASYTGTQVDITDALNLLNFVSNNTIFTSAVDRTFSINGGDPVPYQGYGASGNNVTLYTDIAADPDPIVVTSIDFYYQSESYFGIDYDDGGVDIIGTGLTINIDNDQTQGPDINLRSGDDITLQAKNKSLGSESEGGDINIYAGDGADDDGQGNNASTGGDIQIEAGDGGAGNSSSGSAGGFARLRGGQGGDAGISSNAGSGGFVEIRAGDGGNDNGNTQLGAGGGYVTITAGTSTQEGVKGADVTINSGQGGPNALAGNVVISTPSSANGPGGTWIFDGNGNLTLPGNTFAVNYANGTQVQIGGSGNTGNVTFDNITVQGDNNGLNLSAGPDFTANLAYLQVRAGDVASHIHLDTGNNQAYDLIIGDDQNYVQVSSTGNILLSAYDSNTNQYTWTLDYNGNLVLAGGNSVIQSIANSSLDPMNPNVSTMALTPDQNYTSQALVLDPTAPGHIHLRAPGGNIDEPYANIFLGGESSSFEVGAFYGIAPNVYIHSGDNTWTFGIDGNLTIPGSSGGVIKTVANGAIAIAAIDDGTNNPAQLLSINANGTPTTAISSYADQATIQANINGDIKTWAFTNTGNLVLPGNTFAVNYANGTQVSLGGNYGNSNVANFLANFGSNTISTTGNITAGNISGNISITGNITGTSPNVQLVAGSYTATFDNTGVLTLPTIGGNEGGEINFGIPSANTTLVGPVKVDVFQDRIRFFDGSTKGAYIDLSQAAVGVGSLLNNRVSAFVNAGTFVTMDNIRATVTTSAPRGLSLATVTGSFIYNIGGSFAGFSVGSGGSSLAGQTMTTTPTGSIFGWGFTVSGDIATYIITNTSSLQTYRITLQIGGSFNNNSIIIERLI